MELNGELLYKYPHNGIMLECGGGAQVFAPTLSAEMQPTKEWRTNCETSMVKRYRYRKLWMQKESTMLKINLSLWTLLNLNFNLLAIVVCACVLMPQHTVFAAILCFVHRIERERTNFSHKIYRIKQWWWYITYTTASNALFLVVCFLGHKDKLYHREFWSVWVYCCHCLEHNINRRILMENFDATLRYDILLASNNIAIKLLSISISITISTRICIV